VRAVIILLSLVLSTATAAQELERDRQAQLCAGMQMNRHLPNGTHVDCLTDDYAIEVDFSNKWAEAIGQSLMYAAELERLPGIILICRQGMDPSLCLKHGYLIEQTVNWWRIGMTVWHCGAEDVRLDQCRREEYMQE
jgi:hypothetical protein